MKIKPQRKSIRITCDETRIIWLKINLVALPGPILDANVSVEIPVEAHPSEVLTPSAVEVEWDLSQAVYDFVCLSLSLQRLHPEGQCDPYTVRFLSHKERGDEEAEAAAVPRSSDH